MDIRKLIGATALVFWTTAHSTGEHAFKNAKEITLFENTSLSMCLGMGYKEKSGYFTDQFSQAINGYREFSNISPDAYDDLRATVRNWLDKDYRSKDETQNILMKCIDLSNSADVRAIYEKHDPCKSPDSWLDTEEYRLRCN